MMTCTNLDKDDDSDYVENEVEQNDEIVYDNPTERPESDPAKLIGKNGYAWRSTPKKRNGRHYSQKFSFQRATFCKTEGRFIRIHRI